MPSATPFFREAGQGPGVVCLHANASTSSQWRAFMEAGASEFHVIAADTYGAGKGLPWPSDREVLLRDEVAMLEPVFAAAGDPFALVGHSYGGAIALVAAVSQPQRLRSLVLFEPTLFALLDAEVPRTSDPEGIRAAAAAAAAALDRGDLDLSAEHFIDFWMGKGAWASTPESRRPPIAASMVNVRGWAHALFSEPTALAAFARLDVPVLLMRGTESPASSLGVARLLAGALPRVDVVELEGVGHMGPITHPQLVNDRIFDFLRRH
jgi:pimeloyl-ACP methyl ester carboxylesterase